MSDFHPFAASIKAKFDAMSRGELYTTSANPDDVYAMYLASFPAGTNEIFRERTEHDCSCCRNFIRNIGNVVTIVDGRIVSVWQAGELEEPYATVAAALTEYVKAHPIDGLFRKDQKTYGADKSNELRDGVVHVWRHFHATVADHHYSATPAQAIGDFNTVAGVFKRGLEELTPAAFTDVIDLIDANNLYRGAEFRPALVEFQRMQSAYRAIPSDHQTNFVWANANAPVARFRNTAIGTLIQDLSEGMPLEQAVKAFETKVAPENYKRPSALITPRMVEDAMRTITEEGLEPALARRMARLEDVSVNNVLWVDNEARSKMRDGGIAGLLMEAATAPAVKTGSAEDIGIDDFLTRVLPAITSMEIEVKNAHQSNFMTITAAQHNDARALFKWNNSFAWSYDGNITDSITQRVKAAGGKTDARLRVSLAWTNYDDLDLHVFEPSGFRIYFGAKRSAHSDGHLDVDMNAGGGRPNGGPTHRRDPVENVAWNRPLDGVHKVIVQNYRRVETADAGYTIEIENDGVVQQFSSVKSPANAADHVVAILLIKGGKIVEQSITNHMTGGGVSVEKWGIKTESFVKVNTVMLSPNHWDGQAIGNKHVFFIIDGCKNPEPARGVYNEFLAAGLEKHRKVFEVLGNRTKCEPTQDQLSGLGFSSTKGDKVTVNVSGPKIRKTYNIGF